MSAIAQPMPPAGAPQNRRWMPLAVIILLHAGLFYALRHGLPSPAPHESPAEVSVSFFTPESAPEQSQPKPMVAAPKTTPAVKQQIAQPRPAVDQAPAPRPSASMPQAPSVSAPPEAAAPAIAAPVAAAAPPAPVVPATPKTISSGVEYLRPPHPEYPPLSRRMGEEGKVILRALVNEKGSPEQVAVHTSSGSARLDEAGKQAVLRALFRPHIENDQAAAVYVIVPINFQLRN